jgi:glucosylceramidase
MQRISTLVLILCLFAINLTAQTQKKSNTVSVYTTADSSNLRLTKIETPLTFSFKGQPFENEICIFVDGNKSFQTFEGIGGAITDASAETFYKLPKTKQEELLNAYYNKEVGIGYVFARTNINSCDFSSDMYTYVDDGDVMLNSFNISHDLKYKIPFIKAANKSTGGKLKLFASPWSPPSWMKSNKDMLQGGRLENEFYDSWAKYFVKFIRAFEKEGVPIWGVSIQNEPMAKQRWESCIYKAEEEALFLKSHLGPLFQKEGLKDKKIIVWDHNRDLIYQRAQTYFSDPEVAKYAWGIGFHWYEDWSGGTPMYDNVKKVYESFPDKKLLFTEGCAESFDANRYYAWGLGEKYAKSMIQDFNNGMVGFTDWNILLDETGGPNHVQNFCFAPIHGNTVTGELIYTNAYYYIGHFSKFIQPGAKRIISSSSRSGLLTTAFKNPDGKKVVIVMNPGSKKIEYHLWDNGDACKLEALPHSISTIVY